jgi:hypothetical protein
LTERAKAWSSFPRCWSGRVAQLVEQCPFKAWVAGSSPAALTIFLNTLEIAAIGFCVNSL